MVAIISGGYYGTIFRRERKLRSTAVARVDVGALITLGAEETLHELRRRTGQRIAMVGYLAPDGLGPMTDLEVLQKQLADLGTGERVAGAWLILRADSGMLYPYTGANSRPPRLAQDLEPHETDPAVHGMADVTPHSEA